MFTNCHIRFDGSLPPNRPHQTCWTCCCHWSACVSKDRTHWQRNPVETLWSVCNGVLGPAIQTVTSEWAGLSASISVYECVTVKCTSLTYTLSQCVILSVAFMQSLSLQLEKKNSIFSSAHCGKPIKAQRKYFSHLNWKVCVNAQNLLCVLVLH